MALGIGLLSIYSKAVMIIQNGPPEPPSQPEVPPDALLDESDVPILDEDGNYILEG